MYCNDREAAFAGSLFFGRAQTMRTRFMKLAALLLSGVLLAGCGGGETKEPEETVPVYEAALPTGPEKAEIFVEPVEGITEDFIRGADVSSFLSEKESGVRYFDEKGQEADLFRILADAGINWIRVRVWNDPYDEEGHGFGGGNCDAKRAGEIGKMAAQYGMKLLVDFHYSDFWADPGKQMTPRAWAKMDLSGKKKAIGKFTEESLKEIQEAGADIGMVQIGNEINNGMAGEAVKKEVADLLQAASQSVRKVTDAKVAVHFTEISEPEKLSRWAEILEECRVDYDVFGLSYYMYWHGGVKDLEKVMRDLKKQTGKDVCVLETSYPWTLEDGDGSGNSVGDMTLPGDYPASVQGQADAVRDVCAAAADAGGLGVFYWEIAWVPVQHYSGDAAVLASNKEKWETYGSGWASSYAAVYDPEDAGVWYGGSSWDNQAMFDFDGKALPSLNVFKWLFYGAEGENVLQYIEEPEVEMMAGGGYELPSEIMVIWSDRTKSGPVSVTWNTENLSTKGPGTYDIHGVTSTGLEAVCHLKVSNRNLVRNPSLEESDASMWLFDVKSGGSCLDIQDKMADAKDGTMAIHFWSEQDMEFTVSQNVTAEEGGFYTLSFSAQGGDLGEGDSFEAFISVNGKEQTAPFTLAGWQVWQEVQIGGVKINAGDRITLGIRAKASAKAWGTFDAFDLSVR